MLGRLNIPVADVDVIRFMPGKLSRKRGPVPGAAFLSFKHPSSYHNFMSAMQMGSVSLLEGEDDDCQPVAEVAVYQKTVDRDRSDKLESTIENSNDYKAFCESLEAPVAKVVSAEAKLEAGQSLSSVNEEMEKLKDPKMSAIVVYLREKGKRQSELKRMKRNMCVEITRCLDVML